MKYAVRYYTRTGNTKKLADAVAGILGVEAKPVSAGLNEDADILFLCHSMYAFTLAPQVVKFIDNLRVNVGTVVNISTAAMHFSTAGKTAKLLKAKGVPVDARHFHCRGEFHIFNKGRPNARDIENVANFARQFL